VPCNVGCPQHAAAPALDQSWSQFFLRLARGNVRCLGAQPACLLQTAPSLCETCRRTMLLPWPHALLCRAGVAFTIGMRLFYLFIVLVGEASKGVNVFPLQGTVVGPLVSVSD
jgi:hypothetical protein